MSEEEKIHKVGSLVNDLAGTIQDLKRARNEAHKWTPHLRIIADCLDKSVDNAQIGELINGGFAFSGDARKYDLSSVRKVKIKDDPKWKRQITVPSDDSIVKVIREMDRLTDHAKSLLEELKIEHINLCDICATLFDTSILQPRDTSK